MLRLYLLCALVIAALLGLSAYYRAEPDTFYGIADAKETVISSESAVEIRRILVVQGQQVERGDTLLEVHNSELDLRLSQISHELSELRARKSAHASLSKSELLQLRAQQEERVSEIRAEIKELEAQYELNRQLVSELRSLDREKAAADPAPGAQNPILVKVESLRKMLALVQDPTRVYENRLASALSSDGDPLAEQVMRLEDEMRILEEDRKRLVFTAQISGVIGSINFKVGEKVSSFNPILTLHAAAPSFVRGYIHEDVYSQVAMRQKVTVKGIQFHSKPVEGQVVGVGTRIVEYPERLRKRADILIWGREVVIQLPADNRFLLGEKVLLTLPKKRIKPTLAPPRPAGASSLAGQDAAAAPAVAAAVAGLPGPAGLDGAASLPGLEASGLLWLEDIGRFLIISDDTRKKQPLVFLADSAFRAVKPSAVAGLDRMDDMEAVASGADGSIYLLSSQSRNKNGKLADSRKLLVKARRDGEAFSLEGKVLLIDFLARAAEANPAADWAAFLSRGMAAGSVDIEGMAVRGDSLFLGFKAPLLDGKAVILRLAGLDGLFRVDGGAVPGSAAGAVPEGGRISLWKTLDLAGAGTPCGIADLLFVGGDAYLLSTGDAAGGAPGGGEGPHVGELWHLPAGADRAKRLRNFEGAKPEGLAVRPGSRSFYVAFDNGGNRPSQVLKTEAPR